MYLNAAFVIRRLRLVLGWSLQTLADWSLAGFSQCDPHLCIGTLSGSCNGRFAYVLGLGQKTLVSLHLQFIAIRMHCSAKYAVDTFNDL